MRVKGGWDMVGVMDALLMFLGIVVPLGAIAGLSQVRDDRRTVQAAIAVSAVGLLLIVAWVVSR
jgi:hypothetical protein